MCPIVCDITALSGTDPSCAGKGGFKNMWLAKFSDIDWTATAALVDTDTGILGDAPVMVMAGLFYKIESF